MRHIIAIAPFQMYVFKKCATSALSNKTTTTKPFIPKQVGVG
jgi:hypothetical protein